VGTLLSWSGTEVMSVKNNFKRFKLGKLSTTAFFARNRMTAKAEAYRDGKASGGDYREAIEDYCRLRVKLVQRRTSKGLRQTCSQKLLDYLPGLSRT